MAERVAKKYFADAGLDVQVTSAGVSSEESGHPIDYRAARVLTEAGYDATNHRARRITAAEINQADLVIAAEERHLSRMRNLVDDDANFRLINDYNPKKPAGTPLNDPWIGNQEDFYQTLADIEAAMPGIIAEISD